MHARFGDVSVTISPNAGESPESVYTRVQAAQHYTSVPHVQTQHYCACTPRTFELVAVVTLVSAVISRREPRRATVALPVVMAQQRAPHGSGRCGNS